MAFKRMFYAELAGVGSDGVQIFHAELASREYAGVDCDGIQMFHAERAGVGSDGVESACFMQSLQFTMHSTKSTMFGFSSCPVCRSIRPDIVAQVLHQLLNAHRTLTSMT